MSLSERTGLETFNRVKRGELTVVVAAELTGLSLRQAWRVWKRFRNDGDDGLVHSLRGPAINLRLRADVRDRGLTLRDAGLIYRINYTGRERNRLPLFAGAYPGRINSTGRGIN